MSENTRFKSVAGHVGKVVAARLLPGTDLLTGIEEVCRKHSITYASIVDCFGSFQKAGYLYLVPKVEAKVGAGYGEINVVEGPVEFLNGVGVVCQREGKYDTHFHATMCDKTGAVFGGHMVKGYNPVLTTVDLILHEVIGVQMMRSYDDETELVQFDPQ